MIKLNNKGMTTVEVLICFVLVVIITMSMYSSVTGFNEKRITEEYKQQVFTYKNTLTKELQDDFIKIGLIHADYTRTNDGDVSVYTVNCSLKDGSKRTLVIKQRLAYSSYHTNGFTSGNDYFMILYGLPTDLIEHPLPELGTTRIKASGGISAHDVKDFSINNVLIDIKDGNVLSIYIGFYHPELGTKYAVSVIAPINYISDGSDLSNPWSY